MTPDLRRSADGLISHLEDHYGIDVAGSVDLDVGVVRVDRRD